MRTCLLLVLLAACGGAGSPDQPGLDGGGGGECGACPAETYCDLATDRCVSGCLDDTGCAGGRICVDRRCREGCRDSTDCGGELACLDLVCTEGCATVADCDTPGTACVDDRCVCAAGEGVCGGACTPLDTARDCGACGLACDPGYQCVDGDCWCPPGECGPQVLADLGGADRLWSNLAFDDQYVYFAILAGEGSDLYRVRKAGGELEPLGAAGEHVPHLDVDGGELFYTKYHPYPNGGYKLMRMPAAGGAAVELDGGEWAQPELFVETTGVIWSVEHDLRRVRRPSGAIEPVPSNGVLATDIVTWPGAGLFWGSVYCDSYYIERLFGGLQGVHSESTPTCSRAGSIAVDATHVYWDLDGYQVFKSPHDGAGDPVLLADGLFRGAAWLQVDDDWVWWAEGQSIVRLDKDGGTPMTFLTPGGWLGALALDGDFLYWADSDGRLQRVAR